MTKQSRVVRNLLIAVLFFGGSLLAQDPVQNVDRARHPNLAEAQRLVAEASQRISDAQNINHEDMHGHAEKARRLLVQANEEIKLAAEAANVRGR